LLLTRLYRERINSILGRAGALTVIDGKEPVRLLLPGGADKK
jgi:hypothetical protein